MYFDSNMIQKGNVTLLQRLPNDLFAADVDKKCLHATSSNALFCTHYVGNVIYHKFSHDDVSYRNNGENVKVMVSYLYQLSVFERPFIYSNTAVKLKSASQFISEKSGPKLH